MATDEIKRVAVSQREEIEDIFERERIIDREVDEPSLMRYIRFPNILAVLGARRCGKSMLSWLLFKDKRFGYLNFDDERLHGIEARELDKVLQSSYELYGGDIEYIILDEIQNVPGWELFANRLRRTKKVIITGSNSNLLSGELSTHLTGRYMDFTLFPFSFREFLDLSGVSFSKSDFYSTKKISRVRLLLEDYMKLGGFPEAYKFGARLPVKIYEDIINKDVIQRYGIRYKKALKDISRYLISNSAGEITYSKIKSVCSIRDVHTVRNYVSYLESAYLFFILERFSYKLKQQVIAPKKVYAIDTGIIGSMSFKMSSNTGKLMENIVAVELLRRKSYWHNRWEIYYWKDHLHHEVDFLVKEGQRVKQLIQVTYVSRKEEMEKREITSLFRASKELRCKDLLVITWDYESSDGQIKFIPLWKWLLQR
ncbi:MAG: ATP-binding protein [Methanobacteriota archaeon]|nr:MAG: ATP-binding protein [Euryarchaeota archaeon]